MAPRLAQLWGKRSLWLELLGSGNASPEPVCSRENTAMASCNPADWGQEKGDHGGWGWGGVGDGTKGGFS